MPWLHKSKKSSKAGSFGDCPAAGKSGKVPQAASPQQQLHQPAASHDELQAALHSVLEALRNLTEKQRQGPPASPPQHQPEAPQRHHRSSQEKKLADKKQQQQQQQQQQPEPPPISGETFRNLQNYFSRISSRGRSSTEAAVAVSIEESGTTFGTDQLDPPSSASRLRRRNFRPTRRQLLPPEADIVSGLTSEDLQASDASGDGDKDETAADDATERHDGSPTRRCFRGELIEADVTPERARSIRSPQPPTLTALGCSVVTHCGCPSQQAAAILLIRQEPSVCRPPARAPNQQLPQCDEQHRCSTKSLLIRDAVPEALKPPTEPSVAEAAEKSADCGVAPCSTALNTCADGDSISKTGTGCSTEAADAADEDGEADSSGSEGEEGGSETETEAGSAVNGNTGAWTGCLEAGNTVGANGNTGAWTGCREAVGANGNTGAWMGCHEAGSAVGANGNNGAWMGCRAGGPQNPLQVHSVIESKLLESACESFPPTEAELAAPSSSNAVDSELPRFGKVELPPEPPRTAELGCNSSGSASSATTLEVLDNGNDDCDTEAGEGGSCCTFDPGKSSGFAQLLLTLDRAQRRLEGLAPSAVPPPSGDSAEPPLAPAASQQQQQQQQQQRLYKQRASVQTLNQMLQRSPFVCRGRDRSPSTDETQHHHHQQQQHQQQQQQQHQQQQHQQQHQQHQQQQQQQQHHQQQQQPWQPVQRQSPTAWQQSSWTLHQQLACQPQLSDLNQSNPQSDKLIVTTAASLMTLTQSLQRCVLQIEAAVSRLNGNSIS